MWSRHTRDQSGVEQKEDCVTGVSLTRWAADHSSSESAFRIYTLLLFSSWGIRSFLFRIHLWQNTSEDLKLINLADEIWPQVGSSFSGRSVRLAPRWSAKAAGVNQNDSSLNPEHPIDFSLTFLIDRTLASKPWQMSCCGLRPLWSLLKSGIPPPHLSRHPPDPSCPLRLFAKRTLFTFLPSGHIPFTC